MNTNKNVTDCQTAPLFSVYVMWCRCTNQFYVGVTSRKVETRIRQHKKGKRQFIDREIQRLGWEGNFDWWVIEENIPTELISEREQQWVAFFGSVFPKGYNKTIGGIKLFKHTEGAKATMSAVKTGEKHPMYGKHHTAESKETIRQANLGKHHTEESKEAIRQAHLGKTLTVEHKANISESMTGEKHPFYGKHHTEKSKEAMRQSHLGKHHTEKTKSQMSADRTGEKHPMYGKHHTEKSKEAMRKAHLGNSAHKGKHHTEKTKAILREKALERDLSGKNNPFYGKQHSEKTRAILREKALARHAAKRAAKAVAEENLAAANSTPINLSILSDAVIF